MFLPIMFMLASITISTDVDLPTKSKNAPENKIESFWAGSSIQAAKTEAQDRNVPIIMVILKDGDLVSQQWANQHLNDPKMRLALEENGVPVLVCLPDLEGNTHTKTNTETSSPNKEDDDCPLSGVSDCKDHQSSELWVEGLTIPQLLPAIFLLEGAEYKAIPIPQDLPFRGAQEVDKYLTERKPGTPPTRLQYTYLMTRLERAAKFDEEDKFEKGCAELSIALNLISNFSPRIKTTWEDRYHPYKGKGVQMLRRAKTAAKTNPLMAMKLLHRISKMMSGLPHGETARLLLAAMENKN
ncbi:MAG: hypothetical protein P8K66_06375 [Planctomycetota bacterium]|nr:hypothetical protein [Planctomycetota bacterium]